MSILFGVVSVVDAFTLVIGAACGVLAIVLGVIARRAIHRSDTLLGGRLCTTGIILGAIGVALSLVMALVVYPMLAK